MEDCSEQKTSRPGPDLVEHDGFVRGLARALVRDGAVAEDVAQETLLAAMVGAPKEEKRLRRWLSLVVRRQAMLHQRGEARRKAREFLVARDRLEEAEAELRLLLNSAQTDEELNVLFGMVSALPDPYRTVILMRFMESQTPSEIAKRLDRSVHTVNTQIQRGVQRLRDQLDRRSAGDRSRWALALLPLTGDARDVGWLRRGAKASHGSLGWAAGGILASLAVLSVGPSLLDRRPQPEISAEPGRLELEQLPPGARSVLAVPTAIDERMGGQEGGPEHSKRDLFLRIFAGGLPVENARVALQLPVRIGAPVGLARSPKPLSVDPESPLAPERVDQVFVDGRIASSRWDQYIVPTELRHGHEPVVDFTEQDGRASLQISSEWPSIVRVDAPGFATEFLDLDPSEESPHRELELSPASELVVDRGAIPLELLLEVRIWSEFEPLGRVVHMASGTQAHRIAGLHPGSYKVACFDMEGLRESEDLLRVAHLVLGENADRHFDLSLDGCRDVLVSLENPQPGAPAAFAAIFGGMGEGGQPRWFQSALLHQGFARFHSLPPGPSTVKLSTLKSHLTESVIVVEPGEGPLEVKARIEIGELVVKHNGLLSTDLTWVLLERTEAEGRYLHWNGWRLHSPPIAGDGESRFVGIGDGEFRLFVINGPRLYRHDVRMQSAVHHLDFVAELANADLRGVQVARGAGVHPEVPIQAELAPGIWRRIHEADGRIWLPRGVDRLKVPLFGLGDAQRSVAAQGASSVIFHEPAAPREVELRCETGGCTQEIIIRERRELALAERPTSVLLQADDDGIIRAQLRDGAYLARDRMGRECRFDLAPGVKSVELSFNPK